jgi:erythromycin esterase-like protein/predicted phosphoribosyltransferase
MARFDDRRQAGRRLASVLRPYSGRADTIVLALPRGGVPVGYEVARALRAPLDVLVVRKLGLPGHEELAMGALGSGGTVVLNDEVLSEAAVPQSTIDEAVATAEQELQRRERAYRDDRPLLDVAGKTVIVVDDGLATGSTMLAAVARLRKLGTSEIVVAVPVASPETCAEVGAEVDEIVCAVTPEPFFAVGIWYADFAQTTDEEVRQLLAAAEREHARQREAGAGEDILSRALADTAFPLIGAADDFESELDLRPLLDLVGGRRCVLLGEATHGTHEFYRLRAQLTKRLIVEHGFSAIAVEADWPDAYRVNRYVRGVGTDVEAIDALSGFKRFPAWMWRNADVLDFVGWLRAHNDGCDPESKVGFYGLDLYSLHASMQAVLQYLDHVDPEAARRARHRYECFEAFGEDPQAYGYAASFDLSANCERAVVQQLMELERSREELLRRDGLLAEDEQFQAEQNARVVKNAERYYRTMFSGQVSSWNLRDTHMADTLDGLLAHLPGRDLGPKIVVWAHNSHIGDARATQMGAAGEINLGQLTRERHPGDTVLIGFSTYEGTVTAASHWGAAAERKRVREALPESYEALFHATRMPGFSLVLSELGEAAGALREARLQRAIGVIYRPDSERISHYFRARLPEQFDAIVHVDQTRALEPLERTADWERGEVPETFPAGL